jgi:hypothetical protein
MRVPRAAEARSATASTPPATSSGTAGTKVPRFEVPIRGYDQQSQAGTNEQKRLADTGKGHAPAAGHR